MARLLERLAQLDDDDGGFLSTHPSFPERIALAWSEAEHGE
jgi:Zn-dependent protease with chaperone function